MKMKDLNVVKNTTSVTELILFVKWVYKKDA